MRRSLRRILARHGVTGQIEASPALRAALAEIDGVLGEADADRAQLERSLDLVSQELLERNHELHEALRGGEVGTWAVRADRDAIVLHGFPHPVVGAVRGRAVVPIATFLDAIEPAGRAAVAELLSPGGPDAVSIRFWIADGRGRRWIDLRGGRLAGDDRARGGICLDITHQAEAAARQGAIAHNHDELAALARLIADGWGSFDTVCLQVTEHVARALDVDRVGVWLLDDGGALACVDRYDRLRGEHVGGLRLALADQPGYRQALTAQRTVAVTDVQTSPIMRGLLGWVPSDLRSALHAGILVRGELRGMVHLGHCGPGLRTWTPEDQLFLASLADIIALALEGERRLRAETALEEQRRFLRAVIDAIPDAIYARDREGRYTLANQTVAAWYGTTVEDLVGRTDADVDPRSAEAARVVASDRVILDELIEQVEPERRVVDRHGEEHWIHVVKRPLVGPDGAVQVLGILRDVTDRKREEDGRRRLEESLRSAQRLEALGLLAGGVAHDFNNLLTPILAYAEMSLSEAERDPELADSLTQIIEAAERARDLTRQLLAFGRKQTLQVRAVDLNGEVAGARKMLRRVLPEHIEIDLRLAPGLPPVRVDAAQLHQVLLNLAVNARDAMPDGGRLTFATALAPGGAHGTVVLSVSDTGVGMSEAVRAQLFQPFFTTKGLGQGTGLGLATVYGIVEQHAGTIEVASEPGQGATFTIRLPGMGGPERVTSTAPPARLPAVRHATVLVVEDEPYVLRLVSEVLRRRGLDVLAAGNPDEALAVAGRHAGGIDLLLTDVIMPGMNGLQLYDRIRATRAGLPVVFMTGHPRDVLGNRGVIQEDLRLLHKPFSPAALLAAVDDALHDQQPVRVSS